ncbi:MAG: DUF1304 domain-containing protein [Myxococcaceae bacterium]
MAAIANVFVGLVALLHVFFLVLEMFLWNTPRGHKTFQITPQFATESKTLAANQGLYNGFLAAGLVWALLLHDSAMAFQVKVFFLSCVIIAGIYGGITVKRTILFMQMLPAAIALGLVYFAANAAS